ncbi:IS1096 element passenger TnpR family protein [Candidatus Stoquefichus sp. SB1]|jgi:hypothetical protein|uniref:IS1096 element passenger TnpR family protein n=1 Tax=Candidatus Stoquefichus sp. SB1 TaxID=1658109 RepID=UPI00067F6162|nr:hypothetical protein [Candidatus Stoquefichus sp. SB1]
MILERVVNCIDEVYKDILKSPSVNIQKWIHQFREEMDDQEVEGMIKKSIIASLTLCMSQGIIDDDFFESALIQNFDFIIQKLPNMKKSMLLKIELVGLEKQIYRVMKVPYGIILADLAYLILASMNADGSHLFTLKIDGVRYGCDACDEDFIEEYAADVTIPELELEKGDQFELWYDFGDDYFFHIDIIDIEEHDQLQSFEDLEIIDGNGYGIWEDAHRLLDLYYMNRKEFLKTIDEYGLSDEDFIFEEFDIDTYNEMLIDDFEYLKMAYEMPEEMEI